MLSVGSGKFTCLAFTAGHSDLEHDDLQGFQFDLLDHCYLRSRYWSA